MWYFKKVEAVYKRNVTLNVGTEYYGCSNNRLLGAESVILQGSPI